MHRRRRVELGLLTTTLVVVCSVGFLAGWRISWFRGLETRLATVNGRLEVEPMAPAWFERLFGEEAVRPFGRIRGLNIAPSVSRVVPRRIDESALASIVEDMTTLSSVDSVSVDHVPLPRGGLHQLRRLHSLTKLRLRFCNVDEREFAGIADDLPDLRVLEFSSHADFCVALEEIARLSKLEVLILDDTWVDDECIAVLAKLPRLRELSLTGTVVTDQGLQRLVERNPSLTVSDD